MAAQHDPVLDPGGSVYVDLCPRDNKKTRRTFQTDLERQQAKAESKRKSAQRRIHLGDLFEEWEQQRILCGITETRDFVAHLLAVHVARCPQLHSISTSLHAKSGDDEFAQVECIPETPKNKWKGQNIDDSFESPLIPAYKRGATYDATPFGTWTTSQTDNAATEQSTCSITFASTNQSLIPQGEKEKPPSEDGTTPSTTPSRVINKSDEAATKQSAGLSTCSLTGQSVIPEREKQTPKKGTKVRRALLCSTPQSLDHTNHNICPEDEVEVLTPIKEAPRARHERLVTNRDLPHSPKLFEDDSPRIDKGVHPLDEFNDDMDFDRSEFEDDDPVPMPTTNWRNLRMTMDTNEVVDARKCIAFNDVLEKLLRVAVGEHCRKEKCQKPLVFKHIKRGTCLLISWDCPDKEKGKRHFSGVWSSQPRVHDMDGGTLTTSAALVLSGNNYAKVALMAKFLKLHFMSQQTHNRIQSRYTAPAVNHYFEGMQAKLLREAIEAFILAGDGRCDSPGHRATLLTYTLMDIITKKIIAMAIVDCIDTDLNSVVMERLGFQRAMDQVLSKADVSEIVTDAHPQIRKLMRTDVRYKNIIHQFDVWHTAKNLAKKLLEAGKQRGMESIVPWIPAIKNHLWYSSKTCEGNADKLRMTWQSVLYHVSNRHEWIDTTGLTSGRCGHEIPLPREEGEKAWIKPGTKAQERLIEIVRNKRFVTDLSYLTNFRHTGELEQFHSLLLMYAPKRLSFSRPFYEMRCQLAVIDYDEHVDRPYALDKDGKPRNKFNWSKGTQRWSATPLKVPKTYHYMRTIMAKVVSIRESEAAQGIPMSTPVYRECMDPTKRKTNIASVPRPPKSEILARLQKRF